MINSILKHLAEKYLTQTDLRELIVKDNATAVAEAVETLQRFSCHSRTVREYSKLREATIGFIVHDGGASNFAELCKEHVLRSNPSEYYFIVSISKIIKATPDETLVFIDKLTPTVLEAMNENNFIKRRAIVSKAVKALFTDIASGESNAVTELLLQMH